MLEAVNDTFLFFCFSLAPTRRANTEHTKQPRVECPRLFIEILSSSCSNSRTDSSSQLASGGPSPADAVPRGLPEEHQGCVGKGWVVGGEHVSEGEGWKVASCWASTNTTMDETFQITDVCNIHDVKYHSPLHNVSMGKIIGTRRSSTIPRATMWSTRLRSFGGMRCCHFFYLPVPLKSQRASRNAAAYLPLYTAKIRVVARTAKTDRCGGVAALSKCNKKEH